MLVDVDKDVLCRLLHRSPREVDLIQTACQRYVDDREEYNEARSLLQLVQKDIRPGNDVRSDANDDDDLAAKRKRKE